MADKISVRLAYSNVQIEAARLSKILAVTHGLKFAKPTELPTRIAAGSDAIARVANAAAADMRIAGMLLSKRKQ